MPSATAWEKPPCSARAGQVVPKTVRSMACCAIVVPELEPIAAASTAILHIAAFILPSRRSLDRKCARPSGRSFDHPREGPGFRQGPVAGAQEGAQVRALAGL